MGIRVTKAAEQIWEEGRPPNIDPSSAGGSVGRRRWLAQGDFGIFAQWVQMPPGNVVRTHSHDRDELMVVLGGGCRFNEDVDLGPGDSATVPAGEPYGFVVGAGGIEFLVLRTGEAALTRR
jgi:quercetin dioxygenase-like cupin family protein